MRRLILLIFCVLLVSAEGVRAQHSNLGEELRREGESLKENCESFSVKSFVGCAQVLFTGHPLHIAVGSVAPQNGFGFGPAFVKRWNPNNNWRLNFNADGVVSTNGSWRAGVYLQADYTNIKPGTSEVRPYPVINVFAQTISLNKIAYYGLGPETTRAAQSFFGMRETMIGSNVVYPLPFKPLRLSLYGEANGRFVDIRASNGQTSPSIEKVYMEATAPGLNSQPGFAQFGEGIRMSPQIPKLHDYLRLNYALVYRQFIAGDSRFSFQRLTADFLHLIPLYRNKKISPQPRSHNGPDDCAVNAGGADRKCPDVIQRPTASIVRNREGSIGLRFMISESFTPAGHAVPFYFQPTLGGSNVDGEQSLVGYQDYRFRAPNLLLLQGSIEHSLYGPLGITFKAETGKVALTRRDLEFKHLVHSYAAGLTLRAGGFPMVYVMFAWSGHEGTRTISSVNTSLLGGAKRPSLF